MDSAPAALVQAAPGLGQVFSHQRLEARHPSKNVSPMCRALCALATSVTNLGYHIP